MASRPRHFRKKMVVNSSFQWGLALRFFICMIFVAFLSGWAVYYAVWKLVLVELKGVYLSNLYHAIGARLILYCILVAGALALLSIFFSHKIVGPIYRIKKVLNEMADSEEAAINQVPIRLRKHDYFQDLAETINRFIEKRCIGEKN